MQTTTEIDKQAREADIESIEQVVATVQRTTQNELPDEFLDLFRADAIWTTGGGKRLFGLEEISAFTKQVLPGGMKGLTLTMEPVHVLFIRDDVAAVKVRQRLVTPDGESEGSPLYVMSLEDGQWRLVAGQNTEVVT